MAERALGRGIHAALVAWVLTFVSWRWAFVLFGGIGVVWAVFFYRWFRDRPPTILRVNAAEMELLADSEKNIVSHGTVPWGKLVANRTRLVALGSILLHVLRLVFLHHLDAHLPEANPSRT